MKGRGPASLACYWPSSLPPTDAGVGEHDGAEEAEQGVHRAVMCEAEAADLISQLPHLRMRFGFSRGVFDETPGLQEVIVAAATQRKLSHVLPSRYTRRFQDVLSAGRSGPHEFADPPGAPHEPLTERELQMLKLLAQGLSNQEISERSNVALSTTKWHLRNVFAKLDVTTRTAAIVKAQERLHRNL
jgi:DNA-binding NarL/FixJ family response regulator